MAPHPKSYYIVLLTRVRGFSALPKSEIFLHINTQIRPTSSALRAVGEQSDRLL